MTDLFASLLTSLGAAVVPVVAAQVVIWTVLAGLAEAGLQLSGAPADVRLPVRRALLFTLPASLLALTLAPTVWAALAPAPAVAVRAALAPFELPTVTVGGGEPDTSWTVWATWGAVVLAAGGVALVGLVRLAGAWLWLPTARAGRAPDDATREQVRQIAADLGLMQPPDLAIAPAGTAPYTVGVRRPLVVLPDGLDADGRRLVLTHELAHVQRRDFGWTVAERAVTALFGAHPLAHVLSSGAALDRECLADAAVTGRYPGDRQRYAELLLQFATCPAPALAIGASATSPLKQRLTAMSRPLPLTARRRALTAGRALAAALVLLTTGFTLASAPASAPPDASALLSGAVTTDTTLSERIQNMTATADALAGDPETLEQVEDLKALLESVSSDTTLPELIGGLEALSDAVVYPRIQKEAGIEGRSFVQFVVTEAGGVRDVEVARSAGDPALDAAAVAAVRAVRFRPGMADGAPVPVRFIVPVNFVLSGASESQDRAAIWEGGPDQMPELIGGLEALQSAVVYPRLQKEAGIQGIVFVQFVVSEDGTTRDIEVARSADDDALDAAAVAAVRAARFRPGMKDGEIVAVKYILPIHFLLPSASVE